MIHITDTQTISFFVITCIIIIINFIETLILIRNRERLTNYECHLLSLSISDLLVGISKGSVSFIITIGVIKVPTDQELSIVWFSVACSLSHTAAITCDRLLAVLYPMKHRVLSTRRNIMIMLVIAWSFSLLVFPITFTAIHDIKLCLSVVILITSILILISYGFIINKAVIKRRRFLSTSTNCREQTVKMKKEFNLVCMCFLISITFVSMMLPFSISAILHDEPSINTRLLLVANSIANPIMYFFWKYIDRKMATKKSAEIKQNHGGKKEEPDPTEPIPYH